MKDESCLPEEIKSLIPELIDFSDTKTVKELILKLFNVIEEFAQTIDQLQGEIQFLKDINNKLKGEKTKPRFKPSVPNKESEPPKQPTDKKQWDKDSRNDKIKIDREEEIKIDRSTLPSDAIHKGYREVIIQNIKLSTDNVRFLLERFYSPGKDKLYEASLPSYLKGSQFGPELKSFIHFLFFKGRVTEPKLHGLLDDIGIVISEGQISNILTQENAVFTQEKQEVFETGMEQAGYFNTDDTGARHKGQNWYTHVFCSLFFTAFFIRKHKNRDTVEELLNISGDNWKKKIMVSDDARQFLTLTEIQALCWMHETRHYRKLNPILDYHKSVLRDFLSEIWAYYYTLLQYKKCPDKWNKEFLRAWFNKIFSRKTGYAELDKRIESTLGNKDRLLVVIDYPGIPLHNNDAELAVREPVIKRNISHGTRSEAGRISWENMLSLSDTCRKLDISFYKYLNDRFSGRNEIAPLANIIEEKAVGCS